MKLWRIATATRTYRADDLTGTEAAKYPWRWNADGEKVVYAATSLAIAVLETAAHIDSAGLPMNRFLVELDVAAGVWAKCSTLDVSKLDASGRRFRQGLPASTLDPPGFARRAPRCSWSRP